MKRRISATFDFDKHSLGIGSYVVTCQSSYATMFSDDEVNVPSISRRLGKRGPMYFRMREFGR